MILRLFVIVVGCIFICSCNEEPSNVEKTRQTIVEISETKVLKSNLQLVATEGVWYYQNKPFNGYAVDYYKNDQLKEKIGFYKGKKQGEAKNWSINGVLRSSRNYNQNKLEGKYQTWWENGALATEKFYKNGVQQGIEKNWYASGQIAKYRTIKDGRENGIQKAWLANGKIYINYEAKNGRTFGLKRANLCYQLQDETVVYRNKEVLK